MLLPALWPAPKLTASSLSRLCYNSSSFWSLRSVWKKMEKVGWSWSAHCLKGILPSTWNERKGLHRSKKTGCIHTHSWCRWKCNSSRPMSWMIRAVFWQFGKVLWQSDLSINYMSLMIYIYITYLLKVITEYNIIQLHVRIQGLRQLQTWSSLKQQDIQRPRELHLSSDQNPCDIPLYWLANRDRYIGFLIFPM